MAVFVVGMGHIGSIQSAPVGAQSEIFRMAFGKTLDQPQISKAVAVGDIQSAHAAAQDGETVGVAVFHSLRHEVFFIAFHALVFNTVDPAVLAVRTVGKVDGGQTPIRFFRNDGPHFSREIELHTAEAFQKFINGVEGSSFVVMGKKCRIRRRIIVAGENDVPLERFDIKSVPIQFCQVKTGGFGGGFIPHQKGAFLSCCLLDDIHLCSGDLSQKFGELFCGKLHGPGSSAVGDHFKVGLPFGKKSDLVFAAQNTLSGTDGSGGETGHFCSQSEKRRKYGKQ